MLYEKKRSVKRGVNQMRTGAFVIAASILSLIFSAPLSARSDARLWQTGRLLSVGFDGYGPNPDNQSRLTPRRAAVWWTYCICAGDRAYTAVSTRSLVRAGLTVNAAIRFSADREKVYLIAPNGERHTLRILRQEKGKSCREPSKFK